MKLEAVKSFVLFILIGISLLLTLGLWSTSPGNEKVYDSSAVREVNVGGVTVKRQDIVRPSQITFHRNHQVYGFRGPRKQNNFFKEVKQWEIDAIDTHRTEPLDSRQRYVEVTFPTNIPFEFLPSLYTLDESFVIQTWSVKKMYLSLDNQTKTIDVTFVSSDGANEAKGIISSHKAFETLVAYFEEQNGLIPYKTIVAEKGPLYLPTEQVKMTHWVLSIKKIDERLFVNALFNNPSVVGKNIGEGSYLDGQRALRISPDRRSMEYMNPHQLTEKPVTSIGLLQNSIDHINEHRGWTGTYNLSEINIKTETVKYRHYYEDYPIFNNSGLATIQQQWREDQLHNYRRPLFELMTPLTNDPIILPSGTEVYEKLKEHMKSDIEEVEQLQPAYRLDYHDDYSSVTLEPCWYMLYKGNWQEIDLEEFKDQEGA